MKKISKEHYRNLFAEVGLSQEAIDVRMKEIIETFFYGSEEERLYHPVDDDMAYIVDTGNNEIGRAHV